MILYFLIAMFSGTAKLSKNANAERSYGFQDC